MSDDLEIAMSPIRLDVEMHDDQSDGYDDDSSKTRAFNPFETGPAGRQKYPPLFAALAVIYRRNLTGVLTARRDGKDVLSATVEKGRVVSVAHQDLTQDTIPELLLDTGLVSMKHFKAAVRKADHNNTSIEVELVKANRISMTTAANLLEATLTEILLKVMGERDLEFTFFKYLPAGLRRNCHLPIPFLLKEVSRRAAELPGIMAHFPDDSVGFVRTSQLDSNPEEYLWEDLDLGSAEKQIYFFVDGHRTIDDLQTASGQSRFSVMRALAALIDTGYVVATVDPPDRSGTNHTFWNLVRALSLVLVLTGLGFLVGTRISPERLPHVSTRYGLRTAAYGSTIMDSIRDRVSGAILSYHLLTSKNDITVDKLLNDGLIDDNDAVVAEQILQAAAEEQAEKERVRKLLIIRELQDREAPAQNSAPETAKAPEPADAGMGAEPSDDTK
ncbi:MAG TPA: hypothetical protein PKH54_04720 [Myxococcota bacterium]|nr:hypothetical protein [Myxococcota bacterium]HOC99226.1 hypothetical protein [Myxococcota bacterium]